MKRGERVEHIEKRDITDERRGKRGRDERLESWLAREE